jgi:hypothetical protein
MDVQTPDTFFNCACILLFDVTGAAVAAAASAGFSVVPAVAIL